MSNAYQNDFTPIIKVLAISILFITILSVSYYLLETRIYKSEQDYYNNQLQSLLQNIRFNNNILESKKIINNQKYVKYISKLPAAVYIAKYNNAATALIIETTTPDGYNGNIKLLIAIELNKTNRISNIKILEHQETPGLGDQIESSKGHWLSSLFSKNKEELDNSNITDTISGATISSKAVLDTTKSVLNLVNNHPEIIN